MKNKIRRSRLRVLLLAAVCALAMVASVVSVADAATDNYCPGCVIYADPSPNSIYSSERHSLTLSYIHYLGSGNRSICAFAYQASGTTLYGNPICGTNTATHSYSGGNLLKAAGARNQNNTMTVNAHGDY